MTKQLSLIILVFIIIIIITLIIFTMFIISKQCVFKYMNEILWAHLMHKSEQRINHMIETHFSDTMQTAM